MFRKKPDQNSILEQIDAKSHTVDVDVDAKKFFCGAFGFGSGASIGGAVGAAVGAAVGGAGFGVGALITTPVGYVIGTALGSGGGVAIGRKMGESMGIKEQKRQREKFAANILVSNLIVPEVVQEVTRMQKLIAGLCEAKIVKNTKSDFFDQLNNRIFNPKQIKLYNMLLDQHVMKTQFMVNCNHLISWGDKVKATMILSEMQNQLSQLEMQIIDLVLDYISEKKLELSKKNPSKKLATSNMALSDNFLLDKTNKIMNDLVFKLLWTEKNEDCDAVLEEGIKQWINMTYLDASMFESKYEHKYEQKEGVDDDEESVTWYGVR